MIFFSDVCICSVGACMHMWVFTPCVCVHMEVRGRYQMSYLVYIIILRQGLLLNLELG